MISLHLLKNVRVVLGACKSDRAVYEDWFLVACAGRPISKKPFGTAFRLGAGWKGIKGLSVSGCFDLGVVSSPSRIRLLISTLRSTRN